VFTVAVELLMLTMPVALPLVASPIPTRMLDDPPLWMNVDESFSVSTAYDPPDSPTLHPLLLADTV
jgi:hypothetical protein